MIDDSPSCEIIVYRCGVVQLSVCILLSFYAQKKTIIALFPNESVFFSRFFLLLKILSCDMILSACEYTRMHRLVYHVLLFATSSVLYFEGLSSTIEVYSLYFAVRKKEYKEKERELANETS